MDVAVTHGRNGEEPDVVLVLMREDSDEEVAHAHLSPEGARQVAMMLTTYAYMVDDAAIPE